MSGRVPTGTAQKRSFGESAALLPAWTAGGRPELADRLHDVVRGNLHNPVDEALWGNAGTPLAAIAMAEAGGGDRWTALVSDAVDALLAAMVVDPETGTWRPDGACRTPVQVERPRCGLRRIRPADA